MPIIDFVRTYDFHFHVCRYKNYEEGQLAVTGGLGTPFGWQPAPDSANDSILIGRPIPLNVRGGPPPPDRARNVRAE